MKKIFLFVIIMSSIAFASTVPAYNGYVNDYANVLSNKYELESLLTLLEKNTTVEFSVVTVSSIPADETRDTYAYNIFNTWGIGKKGEDNGLLFLLVANGTPGSKMRLEVGYGLEPYITDGIAGRILDDALPSYDKGDYSTATEIVVNEASQKIKENYVSGYNRNSSFDLSFTALFTIIQFMPLIFFILSILFTMSVIASIKCPICGSREVKLENNYYVCKKCGHKIKKVRIFGMPIVVGGSSGGFSGGGFGGGGFGGFGGGSSGGGGAGR